MALVPKPMIMNPSKQPVLNTMVGNPTQAPKVTPLSAPTYNDAEVKRKALANIPLMNQTNQAANNAYAQYQQQATNARQAQNFAQVDPNQYKTQSATIDDIAKKYGFDFSRDYANRQAEAEAQARRNANADAQRRNSSSHDLNLKQIDNGLMSQADSLDRNYFQQYQQQAQAQVNGGMNGGIAADQDLRMAMARQASMGDSYRQADLGRMQENQRFSNDDIRLAEDLGLINQQGLARADSLYNDRLMQGAGLVQNQDRFNLDQNQAMLGAALQQRGQNIGIEQYLQDMARQKGRDARSDMESNRAYDLNRDQFNWQQNTDTRDYNRGVFESDRGYNYGVGRDKVADSQWNQQFGLDNQKFDWTKYMDGQNLGLSRQRLAQDKASLAQQTPSVQGGFMDLVNEYMKSLGSANTSPLTKYYQGIDKATGGNMNLLYDKYGIAPPTVKDNKYLSEWDKMKLIGG